MINTIYAVRSEYYHKFAGQTLALNLEADFGEDLDASTQFTLGADNGLRGYAAREFSGTRSFLVNAESRMFWGQIPYGPELGTVLFVDTGNVWQRTEPVDFSELNFSAGVGLRLGLSRMPDQLIMRIDFGWPLNEDGFAVTIGAEQHF